MDPDKWHAFSQFVVLLGVLATGFGSWGAWYFGQKVSARYERDMTSKVDSLGSQINSLSEQLRPFEELATAKYPATPPEQALNALAQEISRINRVVVATQKQVAADHSPRAQIRNTLSTIDARILQIIDAGKTDLKVRMTPQDLMRLKTLSESDAANGLLRIVEVGPIIRESTINNGSLGPTTALKEQQEVNLSIGHALRD
jgi:hypothetical protein